MPDAISEAPLRLSLLINALARHDVVYIVTGSVGALAYGVDLVPGDLDIAPALTDENLRSLGALLRDLGAKPKYVPTWKSGLTREECERWIPEPADEKNLDHRFVTRHGELDVVPRLAGTHAELAVRSVTTTAFGAGLRVAHVEDLIALCRKWGRPRDLERLPALFAARERFEKEGLPADIGRRLE